MRRQIFEQGAIPEELSGISEDIAREVLREHQEKIPEQNSEVDEIDDEGNYTGEKDIGDVKISYSRFKDALDKQKDVEKQLAAYREKFGDLNSQPAPQNFQQNFPQQNYSQPETPAQSQEQTPPRYFSAEDAQQIDDRITQLAMQITGLTEEDVDSLDYLDDDDPKIGIWNHARELSKIATYNQIVAEQQARAQEEYRRSMMLNQSVADFNSYVNQQKATENFAELQNFAAEEFFNAQSPVEKQIIMESDARLKSGQATPTDFIIVRDYFARAKAALDAKKQSQPVAPPKKSSPRPQFPRTEKVNGVPGSGGGITNASLAEMVRTTPWENIPQEYRDIILNATT